MAAVYGESKANVDRSSTPRYFDELTIPNDGQLRPREGRQLAYDTPCCQLTD